MNIIGADFLAATLEVFRVFRYMNPDDALAG